MKIKHNFKAAIRTAAALFFGLAVAASAQTFSSGSNGSDGAFDLTGTASGTTVAFMPGNFPGNQHSIGIYNFTYITIPSGVTVRLSSLNVNGPVFFLATGNVSIAGKLDLSGQTGYPYGFNVGTTFAGRLRQMDAGAGGYPGGMGGNGSSGALGSAGDGPGGGSGGTYGGSTGTYTGTSTLVPLIGGSGGGGGTPCATEGNYDYGPGGGSGGGAILIASSTSITVSGTITTAGGSGGQQCYYGAGAGSSGGIRLVANTIAGSGVLNASIARLEAYTYGGSFNLQVTSSTAVTPQTLNLPTQPNPTISVTAVNGTALPATPTASIAIPDASINSTSAVTLNIAATNIPVGTVITLHVYSQGAADQTIQSTPLAGSFASSTATASATFPSGYSMNYVKASYTGTY